MVIGATVSGLSSDTRRRLLGCLLSRSNRCDAADALVHPEQLPVDRNNSLYAQLELVGHVDDPRIDYAGGSLFAVEIIRLGLQVPFN